MIETLAVYLATGAAAGLLAGLFGVGGGLVMVPALAVLLPWRGIPEAVAMHVAIGTSLAVIAATSIASTRAHHRLGGVRWDLLRWFAPGLASGALLGAIAADQISADGLRRVVGFGALAVAAQMLLVGPPGTRRVPPPRGAELSAAGGLIGAASTLIGIGGGSLTVPYLSLRGVELRQAVGTSAAGGVPIAWVGAFAFAVTGWGEAGLPPGNLGYVSIPAFAGLVVASVFAAPVGAAWAHRLPPRWLKRGFAWLLLVIGIRMVSA